MITAGQTAGLEISTGFLMSRYIEYQELMIIPTKNTFENLFQTNCLINGILAHLSHKRDSQARIKRGR